MGENSGNARKKTFFSQLISSLNKCIPAVEKFGRLQLLCNRDVSLCHKTFHLKPSNDNGMKSNNDDDDDASDV